jgi:hypothetical protein
MIVNENREFPEGSKSNSKRIRIKIKKNNLNSNGNKSGKLKNSLESNIFIFIIIAYLIFGYMIYITLE